MLRKDSIVGILKFLTTAYGKIFKKNGVSVRAYKGDAMTLLCFDINKKITENFTGFTIKVTPPGKDRYTYYIYNRISYSLDVLAASKINPDKVNVYKMNYSPLQRFSWVHVPETDHDINKYNYGDYKYEITPRYLIENKLQPLNKELTVSVINTTERTLKNKSASTRKRLYA